MCLHWPTLLSREKAVTETSLMTYAPLEVEVMAGIALNIKSAESEW